jgi:hypothetical protein
VHRRGPGHRHPATDLRPSADIVSPLWPVPLHTHEGYVRATSKRRIGPKTVTGKKSLAGKAHDHASTDTHHAHHAPDCRSWAAAIMHRWPT